MCCVLISTKDLSDEMPEVEETSEVNEESAPVPARNDKGFVLFVFRLSAMTFTLLNFMFHYSNIGL
jgi:hypothetical protein